jgi:hypothetical protein
MNAASTPVAPARAVYRRQTPTVWQALGRSIWQALERTGQRRAAHELRELARRRAPFDPALAQQLLEASQHDTLSKKETP